MTKPDEATVLSLDERGASRLLTAREVAERLRLPYSTVVRYCKTGLIKAYQHPNRRYHIHERDVVAYLRQHRVDAQRYSA